MLVGPPQRCPDCGREIVAPLMHAVCPDCGFEYDEHTRIWQPRNPGRLYLLLLNILICLPIVFHFLQVLLLSGQRPSNVLTIAAVIAVVGLVWAVPRLRLVLTEDRRFAAVTPRGLQARAGRGECLVGWSDFDSVRVRLGVPHVHRRGEARPIPLDWVFDSDDEVADFVQQVGQAVNRYAGPTPS